MNIYLVQGWVDYINWIENAKLVKTIEEADLVLFEGGEDVSPYLYGDITHPSTHTSKERDMYEVKIFRKAQELDKKCLGVCRGAQLMCIMNEGLLVQDQNNPKYHHPIKTYDGEEIIVTSTHHQAAFPFNLPKENYKILGWTENMLSHHENGKQEEMYPEKECEVVYYPKTNCLGIQPHPELMDLNSNGVKWFQMILNKFINNENY